jgi:protein SCO1/2
VSVDLPAVLGLALRAIFLGSLIAIIGAVAFRFVVLGRAAIPIEWRDRSSRHAATIALAAAVTLLPAGAARLILQADALRFEGDPWIPVARALVSSTMWGHAWIMQLCAAGSLICALTIARRASAAGWWIALGACAMLALTASLSGHAAAAKPFPLMLVADVVHTLGAGAWLGTLFVIFLTAIQPALRGELTNAAESLDALVNAFSPVALACAATVAASGTLAAWVHLDGLRSLVATTYGLVLLGKLGVVALVLLAGFYNWRRVKPSIRRDGARLLSVSARYELAAALMVVVLTSVLVATPQPRDAASTAALRGPRNLSPIPKPAFTLVTTDGRPFSFRDETAGRVALLYVGYTNCPDVCPAHMKNIAAALRTLSPADRDRVRVVFVTTDPARDTPTALRSWLDHFDSSFVGLRGSLEEVNAIAAVVGLSPASREPGPTGAAAYGVAHAAAVVAFTPDDSAHIVYPFGMSQIDWEHDLPLLLRSPWSKR